MSTDFVPEGFTPPVGLITEAFVLEPLGPEHNEADHAAWMSSIEHIHASPGFADDSADDTDHWPRPMTLEQNLSDLEQHAQDFRKRVVIGVRRGVYCGVPDFAGGRTAPVATVALEDRARGRNLGGRGHGLFFQLQRGDPETDGRGGGPHLRPDRGPSHPLPAMGFVGHPDRAGPRFR